MRFPRPLLIRTEQRIEQHHRRPGRAQERRQQIPDPEEDRVHEWRRTQVACDMDAARNDVERTDETKELHVLDAGMEQ
jgi:hypothetical protein